MTALAAPAPLLDTATSVAYVRDGSERDGYGLVRLGWADALEASFAPQVGMTCCSVRHRGDELLGERHGLAAYAGCGITMGMSVMHPWANRLSGWSYSACGQTVSLPVSPLLHTDRFGLPVNGVQSCRGAWVLQDSGSTSGLAWLDALLAFDRDPRQLALFPFPHRLYLHAEVTHRSLYLAIEIEATTLSPVPVCCGYRVYIRRESARCRDARAARTPARPDRRAAAAHRSRTHLEMNASTPGIDDVHELFVLGADRCLSVASSSRRLTLEPLAGFGFAHVQSDHREPHVMIETLTATPDALSRGQFPVAVPGRPYRAALRLSIDDISLHRPTLTAAP